MGYLRIPLKPAQGEGSSRSRRINSPFSRPHPSGGSLLRHPAHPGSRPASATLTQSSDQAYYRVHKRRWGEVLGRTELRRPAGRSFDGRLNHRHPQRLFGAAVSTTHGPTNEEAQA
jgi:hypothetical protein